MGRRLAPEEMALWGRVIATVRPMVAASSAVHPVPVKAEAPKKSLAKPATGNKPQPARAAAAPAPAPAKPMAANTLDSSWDRRILKGSLIPDISVDLHENSLSGAYARLDIALEQAIHQRLRVILLVTGKPRTHDRASGHGRGAIAAIVRDWLAASRHAASIAAVRQAHPRHGGAGALYIVLKR